MFIIMRKKGSFKSDKRKYVRTYATTVNKFKDLFKAREYIENTSLYIEYGRSEINKMNKAMRKK